MKRMVLNSAFMGYVMALTATVFWAGNHTIARFLSGGVPPVSISFWRWVVALVFFLPFSARSLFLERRLVMKNLPFLSAAALLGITVFNTLLYISAGTTTAFNISLISMTFPVWIVILSRIFLGQRVSLRQSLGILIVFTGIVVLVTRGRISVLLSVSFALGDLWMVLAAVTFAAYSILTGKKPAGMSFRTFQVSTFLLGLLFLAPFYIWERIAGPPAVYTRSAVLSLLYIGVFSSLLAYLLWNLSIRNIGAARAGMMYYTLPVFSGILAYFFLGEPITLVYLISIILILLGILTAARSEPQSLVSRIS